MYKTFPLHPDTVLTHGRVCWTSSSLQLSWTNAGCSFRFQGTGADIALLPFQEEFPQPIYMNLEVDGITLCVVPLFSGESTPQHLIVHGLPDQTHRLRIRRCTEAQDHPPVCLASVTLSGEDPQLLPPPAPSPRRMEFLGDSITCGYGSIGTPDTHTYLTSQQDSTRTYAALTAAYFGADDRYICMSGQGVVRNCNGEIGTPLPRFFHYATLQNTAPYPLGSWQPDVVVVNIGTNDVGGGVEPDTFRQEARAFLADLREAYPEALVIWTYGLLNTQFMAACRGAVESMADPRMTFLPMEPISAHEIGGNGHPNLLAHRRAADCLIAEVARLTGWGPAEETR